MNTGKHSSNNAWLIERRQKKIVVPILVFVATVLLGVRPSAGQAEPGVRVSQYTRLYVEITDTDQIQRLLSEALITERGVTRLEIIDITGDDFGNEDEDLWITYPSRETYTIRASASIRDMMRWSLNDFQIDGVNTDPEDYDDEEAKRAILADLLRTVNRNYQDLPISLRFERSEEAFTFQLWNYRTAAMRYSPFVCNDILYIYQTVHDSVFIPVEGNRLGGNN